jgi:hypothetical protein
MVISDTQCDPRVLSTMLSFSDLDRNEWDPQDLQAMLRHQLNAPLYLSLGVLSAEVSHELRTSVPESPQMTLGQLLHHPKPPLELLKLVKRFAKICRKDRDNFLPPEIGMLLYYASITVAQARLAESISQLPSESLLRGLKWLNEQAWMAPEMRPILGEGMAHLKLSTSQAEARATESL